MAQQHLFSIIRQAIIKCVETVEFKPLTVFKFRGLVRLSSISDHPDPKCLESGVFGAVRTKSLESLVQLLSPADYAYGNSED